MTQINFIRKYIIDTSSVLDFWKDKNSKYTVNVKKFREIWDHMSNLVENGTILIPDILIEETELVNQDLTKWIDAHKSSFIKVDDYLPNLEKVVKEFNAYTSGRPHALNDAKLISIAMGEKVIVITSENRAEHHSYLHPKIPNVCDHFSVKCLNLPEFFTVEGI